MPTLFRFVPLAVLLLCTPAAAQSGASGAPIALGTPSVPMPAGAPPSAVEHHLGPDADPAAIWDVTRATLIPFVPASGEALRTAVVILPGGGGRIVSFKSSTILAKGLQQAGVAAFILKYRTQPLDLTAEQFTEQMKANPAIPPAPIGQPRIRFEDIQKEVSSPSPYRDMQVADVAQAVELVRARSAEFGVNPDRIVIVGQSNGSILVADFLEKRLAKTPVLAAGLLYGAPQRDTRAEPVPIYLATALDDVLTVDGTLGMFSRWRAANLPAELHVYQTGGHGFGANESSAKASWLADFINWVLSLNKGR